MITLRPIDEVIDFITSFPAPEEVLTYHPSQALQERVEFLVEKKKENTLSEEEIKELENFLLIEHIMRMAKKRAKKQLSL
jgi:hypothetical protein